MGVSSFEHKQLLLLAGESIESASSLNGWLSDADWIEMFVEKQNSTTTAENNEAIYNIIQDVRHLTN